MSIFVSRFYLYFLRLKITTVRAQTARTKVLRISKRHTHHNIHNKAQFVGFTLAFYHNLDLVKYIFSFLSSDKVNRITRALRHRVKVAVDEDAVATRRTWPQSDGDILNVFVDALKSIRLETHVEGAFWFLQVLLYQVNRIC